MNNIVCDKVIDITLKGMTLESAGNMFFIDFDDCVKNFALENGRVCKCVATRDISTLSFTFFTQPKTNVIFKKSILKDLLAGRSSTSEFLDVQKAIVEVGYTSE